ncbi:Esterase EstB [Rubripirellula lacrimiformis]|uniref:Esterase EstB n=1 Tax=Rubripirellula lacrimiformis TaxID=1930273 RepID=A0A517N5L2_9BACT|nr:serine hydrolase domain-containing protein [Rubripirellula lacrimiformis]QDT02415.1 Esterase EstB [Rubripirellula lacrimiformis]
MHARLPNSFGSTALLLVWILTNPTSILAIAPPPPTTATTIATSDEAFAHAWQSIDPIVADAIEAGKMPGVVVAIGSSDRPFFQKAYGQKQLAPEPLPMTTDTVFDLASLTKPIATATSIMRMVDEGRIQLDDRVASYLPEFAVHGKQDVTIQQLLLHVGGLIPDNSMKDYNDGIEASIQNFLSLKLNYPPGTRFRYSDVGFEVLAELIHRQTGKTVHQYSQQSIFEPLGMHETGYLPAPKLRDRAAPTEQREGHWMKGEVHDPRAYALGGVAGHAGLFSTASDLSIYAAMMLGRGTLAKDRLGPGTMPSDGKPADQTILKPETFARMTAPYEVPGGIRGLGWDKQSGYSSNRGKTMTKSAFGHGGFTGTAMWIDPDLDLYVIFLSNRVHPDGKGSVNAVAGQIATIAADAVIAHRAATDAAN